MTANDSQTSGRKPVLTDVTAASARGISCGASERCVHLPNAYRVGMRPANSHQWTSLIRLAYSLAPKGNRNLPQRRNFEVTVLPHQSPPKTTDRQVSRSRDTYRPDPTISVCHGGEFGRPAKHQRRVTERWARLGVQTGTRGGRRPTRTLEHDHSPSDRRIQVRVAAPGGEDPIG
jgi:hypothetical protein